MSPLIETPRPTSGIQSGRVLVVDDHANARESVADVLRRAGHQVACVSSAVEGLQRTLDEAYDVIVTDMQMPGMDGLEFVRQLARKQYGAQVLVVTAYGTVSAAVDAMRHGAFDFIEKPFDAEQLESRVTAALRHGRLMDRAAAPLVAVTGGPAMIGNSPVMQALRQRIAHVGATNETVLISGESGTGKELVALALHTASPRSERPLVSLNCPVLAAHLLESELFGHERGAFTGADAPRVGRFELADRGTILLDEVTEIELALQAKLLRVLQERSFERVGSSRTQRVDVRVLATTNRDLMAEVRQGRFREDLFYRLAVVPIEVPPLRERRDDVPALTEHFLALTAARLGRDACTVESAAKQLLADYHWPGNIRELQNLLTRATVLNAGRPISADELRPWLLEPFAALSNESATTDFAVGVSLHDMERKLIESTLEHFDGHRAKTAQALGIGVRTLSGKLKEYGYAPRARGLAKAG